MAQTQTNAPVTLSDPATGHTYTATVKHSPTSIQLTFVGEHTGLLLALNLEPATAQALANQINRVVAERAYVLDWSERTERALGHRSSLEVPS